MLSFDSHSPAETERFAEELASKLKGGDVLAFKGGLGTGKTTFVRGLARGLGSQSEVSSPTFALVHEYSCTPPLYHFDMYRLSSKEEAEELGFAEYFDLRTLDGVCLVEWAENVKGLLPALCVEITLTKLSDTKRKIGFSVKGWVK